jgi:hypothetical protein
VAVVVDAVVAAEETLVMTGDVLVGVTLSTATRSAASFNCAVRPEMTQVGTAAFVSFEDVTELQRPELAETDRVTITLDWRFEEPLAALFVVVKGDWLGAFADRCASLGISVLSDDLRGTSPRAEGVVVAERPADVEGRSMRFESRPGHGAVKRWLPELAGGDGFAVSQALQYVASSAGQGGIGIDGMTFRELRKNAPSLWKLYLGFGACPERVQDAWWAAARARAVPRIHP